MTHTLLANPGAQNLIWLWVATYLRILPGLKISSPSCPAFWQKLFHLTWSCGSQLFLAILNTLRESHGCRNQHHLCNLLPAGSVQSSSSPTPSPAQSRNIPPGPWTLPTEPSSHTWYSPGLLWQFHWCPWRRAARVTLKRSDKSWQLLHKVLDLSSQQAENLFRQEGSNRSDQQMWTSAPHQQGVAHCYHSLALPRTPVWLRLSMHRCFIWQSCQPLIRYRCTECALQVEQKPSYIVRSHKLQAFTIAGVSVSHPD